MIKLPVPLVGDGMLVPCIDGHERPYVALDAAASTGALESGARSRRGVPPLVLERAPGRRLQVSARHRGVRERT